MGGLGAGNPYTCPTAHDAFVFFFPPRARPCYPQKLHVSFLQASYSSPESFPRSSPPFSVTFPSKLFHKDDKLREKYSLPELNFSWLKKLFTFSWVSRKKSGWETEEEVLFLSNFTEKIHSLLAPEQIHKRFLKLMLTKLPKWPYHPLSSYPTLHLSPLRSSNPTLIPTSLYFQPKPLKSQSTGDSSPDTGYYPPIAPGKPGPRPGSSSLGTPRWPWRKANIATT